MFENMSRRAKRVMAIADEEARRLNHEYVGTEHILLGLVKEGTSIIATILKKEGLDVEKIQIEIKKRIKPPPGAVAEAELPQTPRAKKVIEHAIEECNQLNHKQVETEHLFLGLLRDPEGLAWIILQALGTKLDEIKAEVVSILKSQTQDKGSTTLQNVRVEEFKSTAYVVLGIVSHGNYHYITVNRGGHVELIKIHVRALKITQEQSNKKESVLEITEAGSYVVPVIRDPATDELRTIYNAKD